MQHSAIGQVPSELVSVPVKKSKASKRGARAGTRQKERKTLRSRPKKPNEANRHFPPEMVPLIIQSAIQPAITTT
jgi:hypothetical protein